MRLLGLAAALRSCGWQAALARDAPTAFGIAIRAKPDVVVLGAALPGGGPLATLARLRSSVYTAAVPAIVTGCDAALAATLREAGAERVLPPDAGDGEILSAVRDCLMPAAPHAGVAPPAALTAPGRLQAVQASGLLAGKDDALLSELTGLAADMLDAGAATISVVVGDRQVFTHQAPGRAALPQQTPLSHSFCQWVVSGREPVLVDDARAHPVLKANRAVDELGVVAYAGVPIIGGDDQALGSFCAVDSQPRKWGAPDLLVLKSFCKVAEARLALRAAGSLLGPGAHRVLTVAGHGISAAGNLLRRLEGTGTPAQQAAVAAWIASMAESLNSLVSEFTEEPPALSS